MKTFDEWWAEQVIDDFDYERLSFESIARRAWVQARRMAMQVDEWWEAEEVFMRAESADDEIILGAMRNIASMAWDAAIDAAAQLAEERNDSADCLYSAATIFGKQAGENLMRFAYYSALPQWQPIETAPQDGTKFLLLGTNNEISFCRWHEEVGAWCYGGLIGPVDHECLWMPLPKRPK